MTYNVQYVTSAILKEMGSTVVAQNWLNCSTEGKKHQRFSVNVLLS